MAQPNGQAAFNPLAGLIRDHHRFLLRDLLDTINHLSRRIDTLDSRIEEVTRPF